MNRLRTFVPDPNIERSPMLRRTVSQEGVGIAFICLLDLITTIMWVGQGQAREGNPLMAYFLSLGVGPFVLAKVSTFVPALVAAEWYRPYNPVLVQRALRWAIICYLFFYSAGVLGHHGKVVEFYQSILLG
jgi:hypothetical protein